ncbi:uncharacterized protein LOC133848792 [Drosophila sulfurigaster albostrigata]|uniref:uncharacterized protein LOC133848792 n=1 Tax=Drosophila sulfurigaster albostrigata TaxID=89887 RepID=UPI002D21DDD2|nr:uncharacterized protein LOC133848792 [Drosophila sulfurigaster albostrigata]
MLLTRQLLAYGWLSVPLAVAMAATLSFNLPNLDRDVERLANATVYVASRYIAARINTLAIRFDCRDCNAVQQLQQNQMLDQMLQHLSPHLTIYLSRGAPHDAAKDYTLFVVHQAEAFDNFNVSATYILHEHEFYFLVVLVARQSESKLHDSVRHICSMALQSRVINVVVLTMRYNGEIALYAYKLFNEHCSPSINAYQSNRFLASGSLMRDELFPLRFTNLSNCALNVTAHQLPPHFMYQPADGAPLPVDGKFIELDALRGIDGELLRLLATALRFRVRLMIPSDKSEIFSEDTINGCFAQLAAGKADIAIGGFSGSDNRRMQFTTSVVYHQSYFIFVVRKERYFGPFGQLMRPFGHKVWLCLLVSFLVALMCARCLGRRVGLKHPLENLLASTIGNAVPVHRLPRGGFLRHMVANWLLLTLVLRCAYQAKLFDVLRTHPYKPLPIGLAGLLQANYTLISTGYHDFYLHELTRVSNGNFSQRYMLVQHAPLGARVATISLLNNLAHWNMQHRNSSHLTYVREPIYLYQLVIYFRQNSFFKFTFDRKINQLLSSGVMAHIERRYLQVSYADLDYNIRLVPRITNKMLRGVYRCFIVIMGVASGLFLLERLALRCRCLRRLFDRLQ